MNVRTTKLFNMNANEEKKSKKENVQKKDGTEMLE